MEIRRLIVRLSRKSRGDLKKRLKASRFKILPLAYNILSLLDGRQLTIQELAEEMAINPPALVGAVDLLQRQGYLSRKSDPRDRRRAPLAISKAGAAILKQVPPIAAGDTLAVNLLKLAGAQRALLLKTLTGLAA